MNNVSSIVVLILAFVLAFSLAKIVMLIKERRQRRAQEGRQAQLQKKQPGQPAPANKKKRRRLQHLADRQLQKGEYSDRSGQSRPGDK